MDDEFKADKEVKLLLDKYARDELSVMFSELDVNITQDEVKYVINQLQNGKSPGNFWYEMNFWLRVKISWHHI